MSTQEICLTHATVFYLIGDGSRRQIGKHDITTSDAYPRRTPYVQGKTVVALRYKVSRLNSFQSVGSSPAPTSLLPARMSRLHRR